MCEATLYTYACTCITVSCMGTFGNSSVNWSTKLVAQQAFTWLLVLNTIQLQNSTPHTCIHYHKVNTGISNELSIQCGHTFVLYLYTLYITKWNTYNYGNETTLAHVWYWNDQHDEILWWQINTLYKCFIHIINKRMLKWWLFGSTYISNQRMIYPSFNFCLRNNEGINTIHEWKYEGHFFTHW